MRLTALALISALALSGCATLIRGTSQDFTVRTSPPGATVSTTLRDDADQLRGCAPTPCSVDVPRRGEFIARIDHPDYQPVRVLVRSRGDRDAVALKSVDTGAMGAGTMAAYSSGIPALATIGGAVGLAGFFGSPFVFLDASTGALSTVYPNPIDLTLIPKDQATEAVLVVDPDNMDIITAQAMSALQDAARDSKDKEADPQVVEKLKALEMKYRRTCRQTTSFKTREQFDDCAAQRADIRAAVLAAYAPN